MTMVDIPVTSSLGSSYFICVGAVFFLPLTISCPFHANLSGWSGVFGP